MMIELSLVDTFHFYKNAHTGRHLTRLPHVLRSQLGITTSTIHISIYYTHNVRTILRDGNTEYEYV